jgi:methionyl-tRNA formyltransferase
MNIVFMGTMNFAVPILEGLANVDHVSLVVTQPDRPAGRRHVPSPSPVKAAALRLGIPVFQPERIRRDFGPVLDARPDILVVAAYGQMIPEKLLMAPRFHAVNVHASLLPKYRGGAPMQRAIAAGEAETGVTVMSMVSKMDAGPVLSQRRTPILDDDDVGTIEERLALLGRDLLLETLPSIFDGTVRFLPQDDSQATFAPNIRPEEERLDFGRTMRQFSDHVRAFRPWPTAYAVLEGLKIKFLSVRMIGFPDTGIPDSRPGEIVRAEKGTILIRVADGLIEPVLIQPEGRNPMDVRSFMNGAGRTLFVLGKIFDSQPKSE